MVGIPPADLDEEPMVPILVHALEKAIERRSRLLPLAAAG